MNYREIQRTYEKMGLGTQAERDRFLRWSSDDTEQKSNTIFIVESPNSEAPREKENAQLAPDS